MISERLKKKLHLGTNLTSQDKKQLFSSGLLISKCFICGIDPFWNNGYLQLQVDHIDGNPENNSLINLRAICPNCHSQTPTYGGRNKGRVVKMPPGCILTATDCNGLRHTFQKLLCGYFINFKLPKEVIASMKKYK